MADILLVTEPTNFPWTVSGEEFSSSRVAQGTSGTRPFGTFSAPSKEGMATPIAVVWVLQPTSVTAGGGRPTTSRGLDKAPDFRASLSLFLVADLPKRHLLFVLFLWSRVASRFRACFLNTAPLCSEIVVRHSDWTKGSKASVVSGIGLFFCEGGDKVTTGGLCSRSSVFSDGSFISVWSEPRVWTDRGIWIRTAAAGLSRTLLGHCVGITLRFIWLSGEDRSLFSNTPVSGEDMSDGIAESSGEA